MLIALIVALSGCASAGACPSREELTAAVRRRDIEATMDIGHARRAEDPESIIMVHLERIVRISDVHCDEGTAELGFVQCTFKVKYPSSTKRVVAELSREGVEWMIRSSMSVTLRRRSVR